MVSQTSYLSRQGSPHPQPLTGEGAADDPGRGQHLCHRPLLALALFLGQEAELAPHAAPRGALPPPCSRRPRRQSPDSSSKSGTWAGL